MTPPASPRADAPEQDESAEQHAGTGGCSEALVLSRDAPFDRPCLILLAYSSQLMPQSAFTVAPSVFRTRANVDTAISGSRPSGYWM